MKALITGGAGFIGYHLARELLDYGYEIVLADNFARGVKDRFLQELFNHPRVTFVSTDLLQRENVMELDRDFDYMYHLAAVIGVQNVLDHPYDVLQRNVELLFHMIALAGMQKSLKRFVFASTSEIYAGTLQYFEMEIPTPENTPLTVTDLNHPRTSYMLSKIYGEALLYQSGLPFTIVRPHNFYGPRMGMSHVIPELLKKAYELEHGQELEVFSVEHKRTFCYISDAVRMIRLLAEHEDSVGQAYNVGNEAPEITIYETAGLVLQAVHKHAGVKAGPVASGSPARRCPCMKKTTACIGYSGQVSLEEGIKKTFEWYREYIFEGQEVSAK